MSYYEWIQFVLNAFNWSEGKSHDFFGYPKDQDDNQYVSIDLYEEHIRVYIHYKTMLTCEEWLDSRLYPLRHSRYDYEKLRREDPSKVMSWMCHDYTVSGEELNLLPWMVGILRRAR